MQNRLFLTGFIYFFYCHHLLLLAQQKHIYIACDNHTDYLWATDEAEYRTVGLKEIDYYLNLTDATINLASPYQSRYNLDCAWYVYNYQQNRSPEAFNRLIHRIKSGHISVPYNWLVSTYGGQSTEAVLRGMYWPGKLERAYGLDLQLAVSMENNTQPLGLASLWAGAGAAYSWKGVCGCTSPLPFSKLTRRQHEIYHYRGLDNSGVLMKWNSMTFGSNLLGGYAEARRPGSAVDQCLELCNTPAYPYAIAGAFGAGWDDVEWLTDTFPQVAQSRSGGDVQVYVSNEADFFQHFERAYSDRIPTEKVTYGNDWDVGCATLAPITARIRKSVEQLRTAEAMASVASLLEPNFYTRLDSARTQAWLALGSYWEHNFALGGCCYHFRNDWHIDLQKRVTNYVDSLYQHSTNILATHIPKPDSLPRFFVFNALNWQRTDFADVPYSGDNNVEVLEVQSGAVVPHQIISTDSVRYLRILARHIPSVGYKVFTVRPQNAAPSSNAATFDGTVFENAFYKLTVTGGGVITSLIDKVNGNQEFVKPINGRYLNDLGQGNRQNGTAILVSNGLVSATIACTSAEPLQHTSFITLYKNINRIDIKNVITDTFGDSIRTYSFSFDLDNPTLHHEELGAILKARYTNNGGHYAPPDQPVRHAWQTLNHFGDIGSAGKGITISNEGAAFMKLGNSTDTLLDEQSAQVNVLIGGLMYDLGNEFVSNQYNLKEFINSFSLRTRAQAFDPATAMRFALEHQNPLTVGMLNETNSNQNNCITLPADAFSLLQTSDTTDVILWALKPAEEGITDGGLVARVWNLDTLDHITTLDFASAVTGARKTTHLETDLATLPVQQENLTVAIGQQKIETFRIFLNNNLPLTQPDTVKMIRYTCNAAGSGTQVIKLRATNGCDSIVEITTRFIPFTYSIQKADAACATAQNGQITISDAQNYIYNWSNGTSGKTITDLAPGVYRVTITDSLSGCTQNDSVVIRAATSTLRVQVTGQDNYCGNGFVNAIARGGVPPYRYQWNNNINTARIVGVDAGTYAVTITDSLGCQTAGNISLADIDSLIITTTKQDALCFDAPNGRIAVTATGGVPPYQVSWSNGAAGLTLENVKPGNYSLFLSDANSCNVSKTIVIQSPPPLLANLQVQQPPPGDSARASVNPSGGRQPYRITWSNGATGNQTDQLPGSHTVTVTDTNDCQVITNFTITRTVRNEHIIPWLTSFKIYPNPASQEFTVGLKFQQAVRGVLLLQDVSGKQWYQSTFAGSDHQSTIAVQSLARGVYIVRVLVNGQQSEQLITIQ